VKAGDVDRGSVVLARELTVGLSRSRHPKHMLFSGVDLAVKRGEIVGLYGPSGIGKTTLGNVMLGLQRAHGGMVAWQGERLDDLSRNRFKSLRPLYQKVHQSPAMAFSPRMTIGRSMLDVLAMAAGRNGEDAAKANLLETALDQVGLGRDLLGRFPRQLSGGELQRFAVARALLHSPCFLVADEPTSRLDASVQAVVARLLQSVARDRDMGMLFISHDKVLLKVICDRILELGRTTEKNKERTALKLL
jgi:peptide/nickel transport system ATP-binding protein